jgi:GT2 family glycosyltransferase
MIVIENRWLTDTGAVVVAHDRLDLASRCVDTLRRSISPEHIVVVLNAPNQVKKGPSVAALAERARVVSPQTPQGYGANLNFGVQQLSAALRFVILANDDIEFVGDSVATVADVLRANPRVGMVGLTLVNADGSPEPSVGEFPTALDALMRSAALPRRMKDLLQRIDGRLQMSRRVARVPAATPGATQAADWVIGAAMAVRVEAFQETHGFDEQFFLYFEETDLCRRFWDDGWLVLSSREAVAVHLQGQSTGNEKYRAVFREARRRYLIKRLGVTRWLGLELLFPFVFGLSIVGLVTALTRPSTIGSRVRAIRGSWGRRAFLLPPSRRR